MVDGVGGSSPIGYFSQLALGTAQFGMPYGIANTAGQPDLTTVIKIVSTMWRSGVNVFDTAQQYGRSEEALGVAFRTLGVSEEARVITKIGIDAEEQFGAGTILGSVESSLRRLGVPRLHGLLMHQEKGLDDWRTIEPAFDQLKRRGLVKRVGASVYSPERALQALQVDSLDLLEIPANVFDRRMERAGVFRRADELGKEVLVRSIYLQGVALTESRSLPARMAIASQAVDALCDFCSRHRLNRRDFALQYSRHMASRAMIIVGVETVAQAQETCAAWAGPKIPVEILSEWTRIWPNDIESILDPRGWPSRD
jgi:aryl-alcohol dehydrogenase-like predicted oxidoreductase